MASRSFSFAAKCARVKFCVHLSDIWKSKVHVSCDLTSETRILLLRRKSKHVAQCPTAVIAAVQWFTSCVSTGTSCAIRYLSTQYTPNWKTRSQLRSKRWHETSTTTQNLFPRCGTLSNVMGAWKKTTVITLLRVIPAMTFQNSHVAVVKCRVGIISAESTSHSEPSPTVLSEALLLSSQDLWPVTSCDPVRFGRRCLVEG